MMDQMWFAMTLMMGSFNYDFTDNTVIQFQMNDQVVEVDQVDSSTAACENSPTPTLLTDPPLKMAYSEINDGFNFGESDDTNAIATFSVNQYLEIANLYTNNENYRRKLQFFPVPADQDAPFVISLSISRCPGDFTETAICNRAFVSTSFPQIRISTIAEDDPNTFCVIEPGKSYYLNMIHDQFPYDQTPGRCAFMSDQSCAVFFNELEDQ